MLNIVDSSDHASFQNMFLSLIVAEKIHFQVLMFSS